VNGYINYEDLNGERWTHSSEGMLEDPERRALRVGVAIAKMGLQ